MVTQRHKDPAILWGFLFMWVCVKSRVGNASPHCSNAGLIAPTPTVKAAGRRPTAQPPSIRLPAALR